MDELILFVIAAFTFGYIGIPLFRKQKATTMFDGSDIDLTDLESKKENILEIIKDIEFDYKMGKLSAKDYQEMNQKYRTEATLLIQSIEEMKDSQKPDRLEEEILRFRKSLTQKSCPQCGNPVLPADRYCAHCGAGIDNSGGKE